MILGLCGTRLARFIAVLARYLQLPLAGSGMLYSECRMGDSVRKKTLQQATWNLEEDSRKHTFKTSLSSGGSECYWKLPPGSPVHPRAKEGTQGGGRPSVAKALRL